MDAVFILVIAWENTHTHTLSHAIQHSVLLAAFALSVHPRLSCRLLYLLTPRITPT
jgi:hypothetical protein